MADFLTHYTTGRLATMGRMDRHTRLLFLLGTVWPDLMYKAMFYVTRSQPSFCYPTHSVLGLALTCYTFVFLFQESRRLRYFVAMSLGSLLHVAVDTLKDDIGHGDYLFYPFSRYRIEIAWYQPENIVYAMPAALLILLAILWSERIFGKRS